jgi:hypothetical protein
VDLLQGTEREDVLAQVRQINPAMSYPTLVVDGSQHIVGYNPEGIEEMLGL